MEFFMYAVVYTVLYFLLAYRFVMNEYERGTFFNLFRKVIRRAKK